MSKYDKKKTKDCPKCFGTGRIITPPPRRQIDCPLCSGRGQIIQRP